MSPKKRLILATSILAFMLTLLAGQVSSTLTSTDLNPAGPGNDPILIHSVSSLSYPPRQPLLVDDKTTDEADSSSFSFHHTVTGASSNLLLIVGVMTDTGATVSVTPTYAGQDMSPVIARTHTGGKPRVEIWELVAPATGANTVAVTLSTSDKSAVLAISFTGAKSPCML